MLPLPLIAAREYNELQSSYMEADGLPFPVRLEASTGAGRYFSPPKWGTGELA